jgi:hypothetical protein
MWGARANKPSRKKGFEEIDFHLFYLSHMENDKCWFSDEKNEKKNLMRWSGA